MASKSKSARRAKASARRAPHGSGGKASKAKKTGKAKRAPKRKKGSKSGAAVLADEHPKGAATVLAARGRRGPGSHGGRRVEDAVDPVDREVPVLISRLPGNSDIPPPLYATPGSAGADLAACVEEEVVIAPGERVAIGTGLRVAVPAGYEAEIRPRSGLAARHGLTLLNAPGTIDADYRGEVRILLVNLGDEPVTIRRGERIAQMLVRPVSRARFQEAVILPETTRGDGGFGHTGV
jgi:dUTP pyrophosphatase